MPLNTLRLNHAPSSHPNDRIVFIKPLPRPPSDQLSHKIAETLLYAIAAQCLPIMKNNHLSVTTLEEHEPNPEFIGRNFNNGEVIQLVLRSKSGAWLPVHTIQMVMMHELAHNLQMNHSKKFWAVRNGFVAELRVLWARGFTGEGFWGGGRVLGEIDGLVGGLGGTVPSEELKDLQVCGGTFRSRGRRRKRTKKGSGESDLTWKEKKERRIEKKFGKNGVALGEDEDKRLALDVTGKGPMGVKPRVAQSKRGRELRAAAALARFGTNKKEVEDLDGVKSEDGNGTGSDDEEYEDVDARQEDARDMNGARLLDSKGQGMIKICEEEDEDDSNVKQEMAELEELEHRSFMVLSTHSINVNRPFDNVRDVKPVSKPRSTYDIPQYQEEPTKNSSPVTKPQNSEATSSKPKITVHTVKPSAPIAKPITRPSQSTATSSTTQPTSFPFLPKDSSPKPTASVPQQAIRKPDSLPTATATATSTTSSNNPPPTTTTTTTTTTPVQLKSCPICSLENPASSSVTCQACSHVLDRRKDPRAWTCTSVSCQGSEYVNAGDVGLCGICGARRD